jgi:hypothetical protein
MSLVWKARGERKWSGNLIVIDCMRTEKVTVVMMWNPISLLIYVNKLCLFQLGVL